MGLWLAGWLAGLLLARAERWPALVLLLPPALCAGALWIAGRRRPRMRQLAVALLALALGAGRGLLALPHPDAGALASYNGRGIVQVEGWVAARPGILSSQQTLRVRAIQLWLGDQTVPVVGDIQVTLPAGRRMAYGDRLRLEGELQAPPRFASFDYRRLLADRGIFSLLYYPAVTPLEGQAGSAWLKALYGFKDHLVQTLAEALPMPGGALLAAMLVGDGSGISEKLEEDFRAAGLSHIVVISGWNIAVLAGLMLRAGQPLFGKRKALWLAIVAIVGYTALVGFDPPVLRAAIMGSLTLFAALAGRESQGRRALGLAVALMTAIQPALLADLSFQLSVAATTGLILLYPSLRRATHALLGRLGAAGRLGLVHALDELLLVSLSAQSFVLPLLAARMGELSLVSLPANLLVLPVQPALLGLGALAGLAGLLWPPLGQVLGWLVWPLMTYTVKMVEWWAHRPGAMISFPPLKPAGLALIYAGLLAMAFYLRQDAAARRQQWLRVRRAVPAGLSMAALGLGAFLVWGGAFAESDGLLHIYLLDVGQGDAVFIVTPGGQQILVDGGPDGPALLAALGERMPFWDRSLDVVLATHGDMDHVAGLSMALERFRVGWLLEGVGLDGADAPPGWEQEAAHGGAQRTPAEAGLALRFPDGVQVELLYPAGVSGEDLKDNDRSAVGRLSYGEVSLLLTGDIEQAGEARLLADDRPIVSSVLKVSHHGAATATSDAFLDAVSPAVALVSAGEGNRFGHPAPAVLRRLEARGITVWRTDLQGTIELISDGQQLWARAQGRP